MENMVGFDLGKRFFQVHSADGQEAPGGCGACAFLRVAAARVDEDLRWRSSLGRLLRGYEVKLAQYVKPYVDKNDVEVADCEAAQRPLLREWFDTSDRRAARFPIS